MCCSELIRSRFATVLFAFDRANDAKDANEMFGNTRRITSYFAREGAPPR